MVKELRAKECETVLVETYHMLHYLFVLPGAEALHPGIRAGPIVKE